MQDIYFRGRQPIPELLRIGLMTDHLAETLRLHPPENLRGDVYLYVATPQGTRDVARLLPEEGYTYPVRRDIMQRAGTLAAYAEVQGADGMVWHSVPFTLVVAPLPGADKPLDAAQMTAMQQALTELRKLAARAEAAAERLEAGGAGGVTPEQYGAAGDGVADDHDALAAAVEAAVAAEITPENCTDPVIYTFTGGDELLALTGHGRYTPKADGVVTVTASCGSYEASQKIKIALLPAPCESLKLNRTTAKVAVGSETYIKVLFSPYWTTDELVWESTAPEVATVDATGAVRGAALGNATIRVTCGSLTAECAVAVVGAAELPVYTDGVWALDGSVAYVPLPEVGENHTLYLEMKVDLDTITEKDGYVPLFGTGANGATGEAPVTLGFMWQNGYPTYDWRTIGADGPGRVRYINTGVWTDADGATVSYCFKSGGVYNVGSETPLWPLEADGSEVQPASGYLSFNVEPQAGDSRVERFQTCAALAAALTAGKLHASAAKGYQITQFILYAHDDYVTKEDILKYREGADVDIRFDAAGRPVNAGTSGRLIWSAGVDTEEPELSAVLGKGKLGEMRL